MLNFEKMAMKWAGLILIKCVQAKQQYWLNYTFYRPPETDLLSHGMWGLYLLTYALKKLGVN